MYTSILPHVTKPGRYLGKEYNSITKDPHKVDVSFVLAFPDLYEIGMSHSGIQILYHILNSRKDLLAERCFCPDIDAEKLLRDENIPLFSLESKRSIDSFDVLGITLPYELCYTNIVTMLDLAEIPLYQRDRNDKHPIILGGGPCSLNPEPVAEFLMPSSLVTARRAYSNLPTFSNKARRMASIEKRLYSASLQSKVYIYPHIFPSATPTTPGLS